MRNRNPLKDSVSASNASYVGLVVGIGAGIGAGVGAGVGVGIGVDVDVNVRVRARRQQCVCEHVTSSSCESPSNTTLWFK